MTEKPVVHSTFTIERTYAATPARVFAAFADPALKRRWHLDPKGSEAQSYSNDFRVGGIEKSRFTFTGGPPGAPPSGTPMGNDTVYLDIVQNERLVFAYTMLVGDRRMSASLATVELSPSGDAGTRLRFTEQAAFSSPPMARSFGKRAGVDSWLTSRRRYNTPDDGHARECALRVSACRSTVSARVETRTSSIRSARTAWSCRSGSSERRPRT